MRFLKNIYSKYKFLWRSHKAHLKDHRCEIQALLGPVREGHVAIDIGANKGSFTHALAKKVGISGRAIAFEPQPVLASYLRDMFSSLKLVQCEVIEMGLSDNSGSSQLFCPPTGNSPSASLVPGDHIPTDWISHEIPLTTLDDFLKNETRKISCIKIDTEGHEWEVLKGAEQTIQKNLPTLVFECEQRHLLNATVEDILNWVKALGYTGTFVCRGRRRPLEEFRIELHQKQSSSDYWNSRFYCNNFIFEPLNSLTYENETHY
jgi:FkbM family methyltransferase